MAQMARDYRNSVQEKDCPDEYGRMMATEITLEQCNVRLSQSEYNEMEEDLFTEDTADALKLSNNGKSPGIDGIPYEFYKLLDLLFQQSEGSDNESFNNSGIPNEAIQGH
jgi:hypothetical protein